MKMCYRFLEAIDDALIDGGLEFAGEENGRAAGHCRR